MSRRLKGGSFDIGPDATSCSPTRGFMLFVATFFEFSFIFVTIGLNENFIFEVSLFKHIHDNMLLSTVWLFEFEIHDVIDLLQFT